MDRIKGKFHKIVLVDTGPTNKKVEIAKSYGAKIYRREWNVFSVARQYSVNVATGVWIWFFEADTKLKKHERFKRILFLIRNYPEYGEIGTIYKNLRLDDEIKSLSTTTLIHKKHSDLNWEAEIPGGVVNKNTETILIPFIKVHVLPYGYVETNTQIEKAKRNLRLLFEVLKKYKNTEIEYNFNFFYIIQF